VIVGLGAGTRSTAGLLVVSADGITFRVSFYGGLLHLIRQSETDAAGCYNYNDRSRIKRVMTSLWCHVVGSSTERSGTIVVVNILLTHAEVGHFNVSVFVQQHVVQFQVPDNNATRPATDDLQLEYIVSRC